MPETESIYQNQILFKVPLGLKDLSARKLDLDRVTNGEPAVMHDLYLALADEFDAINYGMNADRCRRSAEQWRLKKR